MEVQRRVQDQLAVMNSKPYEVPSASKTGAAAGAVGLAAFPQTAELPENDRMR